MPTAPLLAPARTRSSLVLQIVIVTAIFVGVARLSARIVQFHEPTPAFWMPAGLGLAALLLLGMRVWPAIVLGALLVHRESPTVQSAVLLAIGQVAGIVVPAALLQRRPHGRFSLERVGDVGRLLIYGALLGPLITVIFGTAANLLEPAMYLSGAVEIASLWGVASVTGAAILAPLALAWAGPPPSRRAPAGRGELIVLVASVGLCGVFAALAAPVYSVVTFPLVTWAALRFGARGATLVSAALMGIAIFASQLNPTPQFGAVAYLQYFFGGLHFSYAATGVLLAASAAERRTAHQVERTVDDAYRALIAASPLAIIGLDLEGRVTVWSSAAEQVYGWTAEEVMGQPLPTVPPDRAIEFRSLQGERSRPVSGLETIRRRRDGTLIDVLVNIWPLFDTDGRCSGTMSAQQDITERKRAQQVQEATYRISNAVLTAADLDQLYNAIHQIISELMPARNFYIALYDQASDTLSFPYWQDEQDPRPAPRRARKGLTEYVLRTGRPLRDRPVRVGSLVERGEVESFGHSASDWLGVPLTSAGRTIGVLAVQSYEEGVRYGAREQSILEFVSNQVAMAIERKRGEEVIRASEGELRALFAAMRDVILVLDREGRCRKVAPTSQDFLPMPPDELVGRTIRDLFPPEVAARYLATLAATLDTGKPATLEYSLPLRGVEVWFSATVSPVDGEHVLWVARSINDQRKAEEALRRSEEHLRQAAKMEAVGRLAGGVAHDFNNLLTSVLGHADLALGQLRPGDQLYDDLLEIRSAGARAAGLTQQLLAFSRKQVLEPRVVDLNAIVAGITKMLRRTIGEDIELISRLAPDLGPVRADPVQMEQVLLNLAVNARDAMPDGGRLTIETTNHRLPSGPGVRIRVEDTGIGMAEEVRAHLFEPFFTTKGVGKGTGLGLATAYGIVQQSGGTIGVTSTPGVGTTFLIDLPQVGGEPVPTEPPPPTTVDGGAETILLVEDEEAVRNLARRVLEHSGYAVLSAPNGEAAMELSRAHGGQIHLLLTDVVMPGMSGPRLAELLVGDRPAMACLFMSGYAATTLDQKILVQGERTFLQKPFTTAQLVRRVRDVIDAAVREAGG